MLHDEDASFAAMEAAVESAAEDTPLLERFERLVRAVLAAEQLTSDQLRLRYQLMQTVPVVAARFLANLQRLQALITDVVARRRRPLAATSVADAGDARTCRPQEGPRSGILARDCGYVTCASTVCMPASA